MSSSNSDSKPPPPPPQSPSPVQDMRAQLSPLVYEGFKVALAHYAAADEVLGREGARVAEEILRAVTADEAARPLPALTPAALSALAATVKADRAAHPGRVGGLTVAETYAAAAAATNSRARAIVDAVRPVLAAVPISADEARALPREVAKAYDDGPETFHLDGEFLRSRAAVNSNAATVAAAMAAYVKSTRGHIRHTATSPSSTATGAAAASVRDLAAAASPFHYEAVRGMCTAYARAPELSDAQRREAAAVLAAFAAHEAAHPALRASRLDAAEERAVRQAAVRHRAVAPAGFVIARAHAQLAGVGGRVRARLVAAAATKAALPISSADEAPARLELRGLLREQPRLAAADERALGAAGRSRGLGRLADEARVAAWLREERATPDSYRRRRSRDSGAPLRRRAERDVVATRSDGGRSKPRVRCKCRVRMRIDDDDKRNCGCPVCRDEPRDGRRFSDDGREDEPREGRHFDDGRDDEPRDGRRFDDGRRYDEPRDGRRFDEPRDGRRYDDGQRYDEPRDGRRWRYDEPRDDRRFDDGRRYDEPREGRRYDDAPRRHKDDDNNLDSDDDYKKMAPSAAMCPIIGGVPASPTPETPAMPPQYYTHTHAHAHARALARAPPPKRAQTQTKRRTPPADDNDGGGATWTPARIALVAVLALGVALAVGLLAYFIVRAARASPSPAPAPAPVPVPTAAAAAAAVGTGA